MSWYRWVGDAGEIVSIEHFGASAPYQVLFEQFGFTTDRVVAAAHARGVPVYGDEAWGPHLGFHPVLPAGAMAAGADGAGATTRSTGSTPVLRTAVGSGRSGMIVRITEAATAKISDELR